MPPPTSAARVVLLGDAPIAPGDEALVQLVLERPIAAAAGDRFVAARHHGAAHIGGGRFLDLRAPARKRRTPERLAQLEAHRDRGSARARSRRCSTAPCYVDLAAFARDRALAPAEIDAIAADWRW